MPSTIYTQSTADLVDPLIGLVNGVNTDFTPSHTVVGSSLTAWVNGFPISATLVGSVVRLAVAPLAGDTVYVRYSSEEEAGTGSGVSALTIMQDAATEIGVLPQGSVLSTADSAWIFSKLNDLLDSWNADDLFLYYTGDAQYSVAAAASYTIGPSGATITAQRPKKIYFANWVDAVGKRTPIRVVEAQEFGTISNLTDTGTTPTTLYYKPTSPNGIIYVYPVPTVAGILELFALSQLSAFANVATVYALPPGYKRALTLSLAEDICPSFGVTPSALLASQARKIRDKIKSQNITIPTLESDLPGTSSGRFDPLTRGWIS
ncbi:MAG: hypothetical protein WC378_15245 [Opitutaceae bacterium]|jgi:hypothetical protein